MQKINLEDEYFDFVFGNAILHHLYLIRHFQKSAGY